MIKSQWTVLCGTMDSALDFQVMDKWFKGCGFKSHQSQTLLKFIVCDYLMEHRVILKVDPLPLQRKPYLQTKFISWVH